MGYIHPLPAVVAQSPICEALLQSILKKVRRQLQHLRDMALVDGMLGVCLPSAAIENTVVAPKKRDEQQNGALDEGNPALPCCEVV